MSKENQEAVQRADERMKDYSPEQRAELEKQFRESRTRVSFEAAKEQINKHKKEEIMKEREYLSTRPSPRLAQDDVKCTIAPVGWHCTRAKGHSGPCAAVRDESDGHSFWKAFCEPPLSKEETPRTDTGFQALFEAITAFSKGEIYADDLKARLKRECDKFRELERELYFITTDREALADRLEIVYKERDAFERNLNKTYEDLVKAMKQIDILFDFINKEMKMTATDPRLVEIIEKLK